MLIIDTNKNIKEVVAILKGYTNAKVNPVCSSSAGRVWIFVSNIPFGGLSWLDVCEKEGLSVVPYQF